MNTKQTTYRKLSLTERRRLVALKKTYRQNQPRHCKGIGRRRGNCPPRLEVYKDSGTPEPVKKERPKKPKKVTPAYNPDDGASLELHFKRMSKVLRLWITEERMLLTEIEYVLHEAGKRLYLESASLRDIPIPTESPAELITIARPDGSVWEDLIPNPDFWAVWLARWLARCLPNQHELHQRLLKETSLWARSRNG